MTEQGEVGVHSREPPTLISQFLGYKAGCFEW